MSSRKVLPLQASLGQLLFNRLNEGIDKIKILLATYSFVVPTEVLGIVQFRLIVRTDIQNNRERSRRMNPSNQ